jgi:hypothetical protein
MLKADNVLQSPAVQEKERAFHALESEKFLHGFAVYLNLRPVV